MDFLTSLSNRLLSNLVNQNQITSDNLAVASNEVLEICEGRAVPLYARLDIGVYRFKCAQKLQPSETDTKLFEQAMKIVRSSAMIGLVSDTTATSGTTIVTQRVSAWE